MRNADPKTLDSFGLEWQRFDQSTISEAELLGYFNSYFSTFPWEMLPEDAQGFDAGCGSGRWAMFVAPKVEKLHCIDASPVALEVAKRNLSNRQNCVFHLATVSDMPIEDASMDFGYSLGVLHHLPDPMEGLRACVSKLKVGAPLLVYLYYAFDNRAHWYRSLWLVSDWIRKRVALLPSRSKHLVTDAIALLVYLPLARFAFVLEKLGVDTRPLPLSSYRARSFYSIRTDALDRFGTVLESRFTRDQVRTMMESAGLTRISFREEAPYWCAVGYRKC